MSHFDFIVLVGVCLFAIGMIKALDSGRAVSFKWNPPGSFEFSIGSLDDGGSSKQE